MNFYVELCSINSLTIYNIWHVHSKVILDGCYEDQEEH